MTLLRTISLAACLLPFAAAGAQGRPQPRPVLEALDTNHDGSLSPDEIQAAPQTLLLLDLNHDGQLTPDEIVPRLDNAGAKPDELVRQLMAFDKNNDGFLTQDELPARMAGMFRRGDTDHDGKLTPAEIRAMARAQNAPNGIPLKPGEASGLMRLDPILNALDADHDGTLSPAEIAAAPAALLTLDSNHDGALSSDEIKVRQMSAAERATHLLEEWDTDKDGKLSKDEAPERMLPDFDRIDTNHDGFLDQPELVAYFTSQAAAPTARAPKEKQ